jgi:uncharacterized repeat protein (TIGR01451 family)
LTPGQVAQGASATLTVSGAHFDGDAQAAAGAGVTVTGVTVNAQGTQVLVALSVSPTAAVGPRSLAITNPRSGLAASASFRVVDTTVPAVQITEPANGAELASPTVVVRGTVSEPGTVTVNGVNATVASLAFTATVNLGTSGPHRLAAVATDASGNRGTTFVDVVVAAVDATPPTLALTATPSQLWPPDHRMVPVTIGVTVHDETDASPAVVLLSVTSSEPDDARGNDDGTTVNDIQGAAIGTDDRQVLLRAERAGKGPGRVYTLRYRATDDAGNSVEQTVTVRCPHDQGADLALAGSARASVLEGGIVEYALTITNLGPETATGIVVTDTLPPGVVFKGPASCRGTTVRTCKLANIAKGKKATLKILLATTAPGTLTNTVTVASALEDPQPANNTASFTTDVTPLQPVKDQVADLKAQVGALVAGHVLEAKEAKPLTAALDGAATALGTRDLAGAAAKMKTFVATVQKFVKQRVLTSAQAAPLLDGGNAVLDALD